MDNPPADPNPERLDISLPRFCFEQPSHANAFRLRSGTWKFEFDTMDIAAIREHVGRDVRPRWSAELFPGFGQFRVLELGPQDGFITAGLEAFGVGSIMSIEANTDSFLRCLVLKNALGLQATYLLGDFLTYLDDPTTSADLIYASGVLYHLEDPVAFLLRCGQVARHLYLWTFLYDKASIEEHPYESLCFEGTSEQRVGNACFTYHRRVYPADQRSSATYAGGIVPGANWMTLADIERALALAGYAIDRTVEDSFSGVSAMNIWATRTDQAEAAADNTRAAAAPVTGAPIAVTWSESRISDETYRAKFVTVPAILEDWLADHGGLAGRDILDFGCGEATAALAIALRHQARRVVGIDVVADIEQCRPLAEAQLGLRELPANLHLHRILPGEFHDPDDRFDVIYSWSVFEHLDQRLLPGVLAQLRDALRPEGVLFLQVGSLFYSSDGSHLMRWVPEPWGHLQNQHSVYMDKLAAACPDPGEFQALRSMFEQLNRLTAAELVRHAEAAGFRVLQRRNDEHVSPIPPALADIYRPDTLLSEQLVLLLQPA